MFKPLYKISLCTALLVLTGCAGLSSVGPDYIRPDVPALAEWKTQAVPFLVSKSPAPAVSEQWWQQLGDAELDALIEQALTGDLSIAVAQARLAQARANRQVAISAFLPTLSATAAATPTNYGATERPDQTTFDAGFDASWEIDVFGGNRRAAEAADAEQAAAMASLDNIRVTVIAEVAQNYVELRNAQRRLEIARRNLQFQSETLQIAQWRVQAGLVRQTDADQARSNLAQTRASLPDLEINQARALNRLAVLTGQVPGALHTRLTIKPLPKLPATIATDVPAVVLTQRPDIQVAERELAAQTARVGQQVAQRYPSLNLGASFSWSAYSLTGLGTIDAFVSRVVGRLAATLFDGGRLESLVQVQSELQKQALANYKSVVLKALEEVENALISHALSRERAQAWDEAAEAATSAATQSRQLYEAGLVDFEQVLITDRAQLNAQESLAQSRATELSTLIQLYKSLGGGWQLLRDTTDTTTSEVP